MNHCVHIAPDQPKNGFHIRVPGWFEQAFSGAREQTRQTAFCLMFKPGPGKCRVAENDLRLLRQFYKQQSGKANYEAEQKERGD